MTLLYRTDDIRRIEAAASHLPLMQRAGRAAADLAIQLSSGGAVLVLAGPGNNGGDAFEAARLLRERFFDTYLVFAGKADALPKDAKAAYNRFSVAGGTVLPEIPDAIRWSLIIDGLFGIGLKRDIATPYSDLIESANTLAERDCCPLLALDCPSGLDSDTGKRHGATIRASHTITFIGAKPGLFTGDGPDHAGAVSVATLDLEPSDSQNAGSLIDRNHFASRLRPRPRNSHKGTYGEAGILGGAPSMVGAALLAARAALRIGAGRVYLGLLDEHGPAIDFGQPELMVRKVDGLFAAQLTALACGPGMGRSAEAQAVLAKALASTVPLVLDADALNLLAEDDTARKQVNMRGAPTLLTPHPAEAARLLKTRTAEVQQDRVRAAQTIASGFHAYVALKGCGTIVAAPDGQWFINPSGNPGLATAGSGDVLTGIVVSLLAQGWDPLAALLGSVHLHGASADRLVAQGVGPVGLTAGELIDSARSCLNSWISRAD